MTKTQRIAELEGSYQTLLNAYVEQVMESKRLREEIATLGAGDGIRRVALQHASQACIDEYLECKYEGYESPEDAAYNRAVEDCVDAIYRLLKETN